jgi:hypothetical protein
VATGREARTIGGVSDATDPRQRFVDAVRARLDAPLAAAGFPFNGVYGDEAGPPHRRASVLYEGVVADFLARYPGLDPVWDTEWRHRKEGCVDLWLTWSEADDSIEVSLEHWPIARLAEKYGDESAVSSLAAALRGSDDLRARVDVIAALLERSLRAASVR